MLDPQGGAHTQQSLYKRLGGYDVIAAFVADLMPRLRSDAALGVYWKGISDDSARRGDQLLVDFNCSAFEGPVYYAGRLHATPTYRRAELLAGNRIKGPALIEEYASTTVLMPGDAMEVDAFGNLVIAVGGRR